MKQERFKRYQNWLLTPSLLLAYLKDKETLTLAATSKKYYGNASRHKVQQVLTQQINDNIENVITFCQRYHINKKQRQFVTRRLSKVYESPRFNALIKTFKISIQQLEEESKKSLKTKAKKSLKMLIPTQYNLDIFEITQSEYHEYMIQLKKNFNKNTNIKAINANLARQSNLSHIQGNTFMYIDKEMSMHLFQKIIKHLYEYRLKNKLVFMSLDKKELYSEFNFKKASHMHSFLKKMSELTGLYKKQLMWFKKSPRVDFINVDTTKDLLIAQMKLMQLTGNTSAKLFKEKFKPANYNNEQLNNFLSLLTEKDEYIYYQKTIIKRGE